jgi:REP-associated tyrosine transposase
MPRQARIGLPDLVYHVTNRGNNRGRVFQEEEDFRKYLEILGRYKAKEGFRLYHWVLMDNHVHLLLGIPENGLLAKVMHGINLSYTAWFNRKYRRVGHLWQGRFKSFPVENDAYLLACGRYIERNPLRAGMVENPGEYRWSSFPVHADGLQDGITDRQEIFPGQFGAAPDSYRRFVCENREAEEQELLKKMSNGVIGSPVFQESIRRNALMARKPQRGRPRKK